MFSKIYWLAFLAVTPLLSLFSTPLDEYVKAPDAHYQWQLLKTAELEGEDVRVFTLELTSQKWRDEKEVDKPIWKHELVIAVPKKRLHKTATLTIGGGIADLNTGNAYAEITPQDLAVSTSAIACQISLIPNQHLKFSDESDKRYVETGRREDALVAYTWDKYLKTQDPNWLLRLPMTKAVVRGMDAIQQFVTDELNLCVDGFILTGKSKRGWTAWSVAAVDKRVKGLVPIVIDLLNLKESFLRHYAAYGSWSPAIKDYTDIQIDQRWESPGFKSMMDIIEPYSYNARFTMPKYVINASGDEFFLPDSSRLYFGHLPGEKHLLSLPNTGHYVTPELYRETVLAYLQFLLSGKPLPVYQWELSENNTLIVTTPAKPVSAKVWRAENSEGRDFRVTTIGKTWQSTPLEPSSDGSYKVSLAASAKGWNAHYVELTFLSPQGLPLRVTTDVIVLPDLFPQRK